VEKKGLVALHGLHVLGKGGRYIEALARDAVDVRLVLEAGELCK
jgi:hypothetical protein